MSRSLLCTALLLAFTCLPSLATAQVCGDAFQDPSEDCDDGNSISGDGCSSSCLEESGYTCNAPFNLSEASTESWGSSTSWNISSDCKSDNSSFDPFRMDSILFIQSFYR